MSARMEHKIELVARYLQTQVRERGGECYVKSRFIAQDVELSAKEIGAVMRRLEADEGELAVERWAYSGGTTWRVLHNQ